jgi:cysteine desulfurase
MAIACACAARPERDEIVTTRVEHAAVLACCAEWERLGFAKIRFAPIDEKGRIDIDGYRRLLGPRTALVSVMYANNETGNVHPIQALAELARECGALFHTDAVQAAGKVPLAIGSTSVDLLSMSGHKLHGPKGIGALYVRQGVRARPLMLGGRQERGRRAGTENVPAIVGLGVAAEFARANLTHVAHRVASLRDRLERELLGAIGGCRIVGDTSCRLPNTSTIAFEAIDGFKLVQRLADAGVAVSSGSACASGSIEPSHVLRAMRVPFSAARGAIRFSLSRDNDDLDIDRVVSLVPTLVFALREQRTRSTRESWTADLPRLVEA